MLSRNINTHMMYLIILVLPLSGDRASPLFQKHQGSGSQEHVSPGKPRAAVNTPTCRQLTQYNFISCSHWCQGWGSTFYAHPGTQAGGGSVIINT